MKSAVRTQKIWRPAKGAVDRRNKKVTLIVAVRSDPVMHAAIAAKAEAASVSFAEQVRRMVARKL